ncbi:hypothetical protein DES53_108315 [Roseimicrobium gellanilyticum]|uniref:Uncharacterized protein n=1 Tax=Roseimicrobium gellanilyticum TaxID=748857 RepID=A0A366HGL7_9BACT|nr:hypothetical protein DES53_108315 [Roseimicrobium gellanilyticum]
MVAPARGEESGDGDDEWGSLITRCATLSQTMFG